ncbi:MAG: helix-turn-helix transcriptional regulator [Candidatus Daviesbacteria bacterium]|nr:helix-turn-helix transcriptional regulator [Candidatus Daviesbacteria bacterium]
MAKLTIKGDLSTSDNTRLKVDFTQNLSERLRDVRKSKKMTQQEVAEKAGLHLTYIGHLEAGKYHPTMFVVWKIAKALGVSLDELVNF